MSCTFVRGKVDGGRDYPRSSDIFLCRNTFVLISKPASESFSFKKRDGSDVFSWSRRDPCEDFFRRPSSSDARVLIEVLPEKSGPIRHHAGGTHGERFFKVFLLVQHPQVSRDASLSKMIYHKLPYNEPV